MVVIKAEIFRVEISKDKTFFSISVSYKTISKVKIIFDKINKEKIKMNLKIVLLLIYIVTSKASKLGDLKPESWVFFEINTFLKSNKRLDYVCQNQSGLKSYAIFLFKNWIKTSRVNLDSKWQQTLLCMFSAHTRL